MEDNGTSILDVTNPKQPKYLAHIPGAVGQAEAGGAQMVRVCDGSTLPRADRSKVYLLRSFGGLAHEIWDVSDPIEAQTASRSWSAACATRTRAGGNAIPGSRTSWARRPSGARGA